MKGKDAQSLEKLFHQRFKEIDKLNKQNELTKKNLADLKKDPGHDAEQIRNRKI